MEEKKLWYAVQESSEDALDYGSLDLEEAKEMARKLREECPNCIITVVDPEDSFCLYEITDF